MLLRHATFARNLPTIIKAGLLTSKSQGELPVVWMCGAARMLWAAAHVVGRHCGRIENDDVLEIDVPRRWLRRSKKGLWYSRYDIPPERVRGVVTFAALARSPLEEAAGR
jgi:hypothetical protein